MGRAPCCDKANVKRGPWSPEEDLKLKEYMEKFGTGGNWIALPQKAGLKRCGKSCRLRWLNYLRPNIKHGEFSDEEDRIICSLYASIGSRWSIIAAQLPGRTDNDIKNYWNTKLKKKLMGLTNNNNNNGNYNNNLQKKYNNQYIQYPMNNMHYPSSMSSSSTSSPMLSPSLSSSSPYQCTSTAYYNPPSMSFTGFETTPCSSMPNYQSTLLMFGGDNQASCSNTTSDGSINQISHHGRVVHQVKCEEDHMQQNYNSGVHVEGKRSDDINILLDLKPSVNNSNNTELWGQSSQSSLLDYGLEEIKQLISTSFNCLDENKAEESTNVMYY